jgi:hypothetical protein
MTRSQHSPAHHNHPPRHTTAPHHPDTPTRMTRTTIHNHSSHYRQEWQWLTHAPLRQQTAPPEDGARLYIRSAGTRTRTTQVRQQIGQLQQPLHNQDAGSPTTIGDPASHHGRATTTATRTSQLRPTTTADRLSTPTTTPRQTKETSAKTSSGVKTKYTTSRAKNTITQDTSHTLNSHNNHHRLVRDKTETTQRTTTIRTTDTER